MAPSSASTLLGWALGGRAGGRTPRLSQGEAQAEGTTESWTPQMEEAEEPRPGSARGSQCSQTLGILQAHKP